MYPWYTVDNNPVDSQHWRFLYCISARKLREKKFDWSFGYFVFSNWILSVEMNLSRERGKKKKNVNLSVCLSNEFDFHVF